MSKKKELLYCYQEKGICKYEYPMINGLNQYIQIRGADRSNPLLLFLHGGPGGSMAGLCHVLQAEWEKHFTVVNWDQRNTCKTFLANKKNKAEIAKTGSISDYTADIDAVIKYLHTVYTFDKIILMGFSWGSLIGSAYAKSHPENVSCYIGVGQQVDYFEALELSCNQIRELAKGSAEDTAKIDAFMKMASKKPQMDAAFMKELISFSELGTKYIARDGAPFPVKALMSSPFLKFREKKTMIRTDYTLFEGTYKTLTSYNFRSNLHFDVPVLFISGDEDFVCPNRMIADCFDEISAPKKKNVVIPKATHTCFLDKPEEFLQTVLDFCSCENQGRF